MSKLRGKGEGTIRFDERRQEYVGALQKDGKRYFFYSGKGGRRSDVVAKMNQWRLDHNTVEEPEVIRRTLAVEMAEWMEAVKKPEIKPTTFDRLESTIKCHITDEIGAYYLDEISDAVIKKEVFDKINLGSSSVRKVYDALNGFLKYAVRKKLIPVNPMADMKAPTNNIAVDARKASMIEEKDEVCPLTIDEMKRLKEACLNVCASTGERRYKNGSAYLLVMNTGIRMGEALALQWSDVDWENRTISITKNLAMVKDRESPTEERKHKLIIQNTPKTAKSRRIIPLNREAVAALEDLKKLTWTKKTNFIIHTAQNAPMAPRNFDRGFTYIYQRAGIETTGVHALRHTYATRLFEKGVDIKVISELLGHSSVQITYRVYVHVIERLKKQAVEALDLI